MKATHPLPTLEVWMHESHQKVKGKAWPKLRPGVDDAPLDAAGFEEPCQLKLHFPNGKTYETSADRVYMKMYDDDRLDSVSIFLPQNPPVDYQENISRVEAVVDGLRKLFKFANEDDFAAKVKEWRGKKKSEFSVATKLYFEDSFIAFFEIEPMNDEKTIWYISFNISYDPHSKGKIKGGK